MITRKSLQVYKYVLFDYDSTIARVPVDWPKARVDFRDYLVEQFGDLDIPAKARVDEMEAIALRFAPEQQEQIFRFRLELESKLDGSHEPIEDTCAMIRDLSTDSSKRLYIISNNLHRTVELGLRQFRLYECFERILGIDNVGVPKPDTRAFELLQDPESIEPSDCCFIGDNDRTDGGFCRALGIPFINVAD